MICGELGRDRKELDDTKRRSHGQNHRLARQVTWKRRGLKNVGNPERNFPLGMPSEEASSFHNFVKIWTSHLIGCQQTRMQDI